MNHFPFTALRTTSVKMAFCQSGGPERRIHECAVVTGQPSISASFVAPSARQSSQVMGGGWGQMAKYAIRILGLARGYALRIVPGSLRNVAMKTTYRIQRHDGENMGEFTDRPNAVELKDWLQERALEFKTGNRFEIIEITTHSAP
jgi:hypothetical protein